MVTPEQTRLSLRTITEAGIYKVRLFSPDVEVDPGAVISDLFVDVVCIVAWGNSC